MWRRGRAFKKQMSTYLSLCTSGKLNRLYLGFHIQHQAVIRTKKKKSAWGKVALNNNKNYVYVNNENQGPSLFPGKRTASKNRCWHSPGEIASQSSSSGIQAPDPVGEKK